MPIFVCVKMNNLANGSILVFIEIKEYIKLDLIFNYHVNEHL